MRLALDRLTLSVPSALQWDSTNDDYTVILRGESFLQLDRAQTNSDAPNLFSNRPRGGSALRPQAAPQLDLRRSKSSSVTSPDTPFSRSPRTAFMRYHVTWASSPYTGTCSRMPSSTSCKLRATY